MKVPIKKAGKSYPLHPKDNMLVKCYCFDWSPYTAVGMFIPYKVPEKHRNFTAISRFCVLNDKTGKFECSKETWLDCEKWEYVKE